jgi:hypothetical protein
MKLLQEGNRVKIKKIFEIEFDEPSPHWLCADNLATALIDYCRGAEANFVVKELARYPDYEGQIIEHTNRAVLTKSDRELLELLGIPSDKEGDHQLDMICRDMSNTAFDPRVRALEERGYTYVPKVGWVFCITTHSPTEEDFLMQEIKEKAKDYKGGFLPIPVEPPLKMTEEEKLARFHKELSKLDAAGVGMACMGTGMCAGCGKLRGSMAIYGGVPCEECGYTPERLTQESIDGRRPI